MSDNRPSRARKVMNYAKLDQENDDDEEFFDDDSPKNKKSRSKTKTNDDDDWLDPADEQSDDDGEDGSRSKNSDKQPKSTKKSDKTKKVTGKASEKRKSVTVKDVAAASPPTIISRPVLAKSIKPLNCSTKSPSVSSVSVVKPVKESPATPRFDNSLKSPITPVRLTGNLTPKTPSSLMSKVGESNYLQTPPGGLRLGLSRNRKSTSLHPNIRIT